jgi:hypothetical protein
VNDLPPSAIEHLFPFIVLITVSIIGLVALVTGMWAGFRWLKTQIRETAQEIVSPFSERLARVEDKADAAHRRMDAAFGIRP